MTQKTFFRTLVLIAALVSQNARPATSQNPQTDGYRRQTSVTLIPRGLDGQTLQLNSADIYLNRWYDGKLVPLPRSGQTATLRLDQDWLCSAWTDICKSPMEPGRIVLQANGYAPVTAIVYWPGQQRAAGTPAATSAGIEFSGGRDIRIEEGSTRSVDIAFRRSVPRIARIVDESGLPAAGIELDAWLYFGILGRLGVIQGEALASGKTDANGQISFPDVDGEVAIELWGGPFVFRNPDRVSQLRQIITPAGATAVTTLILHRFQKQPLNIDFVSRNGRASGLILGTCMKFCGGACCGDLATTNSQGQIRVEDFYPEETESLYLTDKSGTVLWKSAAPRIGSTTAIPTITIP
jgi:hypothetical protein